MREKMKYYLKKNHNVVICVPHDRDDEFRYWYNIRDFVKITEASYRRLSNHEFFVFYLYPNVSQPIHHD